MSSPDNWTLEEIHPLDRITEKKPVKKCRENRLIKQHRLRGNGPKGPERWPRGVCDGGCQDPSHMRLLIDRKVLYQDLLELLSRDNQRKLIEVEKLYLQTININKSELGQIRSAGYYFLIISMVAFILFGICNLEVNATYCLGLLIFGLNFSLFVYFVRKSSSVVAECREQFYDLSKVRRIVTQIEAFNLVVWQHKCEKQ